jgi:hypothetical protein
MMINFVLSASKNYALVQTQINQAIQKYLPTGAFTETYEQYAEGSVNFTLFIDNEADVLMSHGAADKNYMWRRSESGSFLNHHKKRKLLMVPGEFSVDRIQNSSLSSNGLRAMAVGWPRLDTLLTSRSDLFRISNKKRVLYAPTHDYHVQKNGLIMSSYPEFMPFFEKLEKIFDVKISTHPRNRTNKTPTSNLLLWADIVISDHGTMVWEALALGKPVIFPDWLIGEWMLNYKKNSAEWHLFHKKIGWHADSFEHMVELIQAPNAMTAETKKFLDSYILKNSYGQSGKIIANTLLEMASR